MHLSVLGMAAVRNLALAFSLISSNGKGLCRSFPYSRFWSGSVIRAIAMQRIMMVSALPGSRRASASDCFRASAASGWQASFPPSIRVCSMKWGVATSCALLDLERKTFAMTHVELSAAMLADWGMPRFFIGAVLGHESA
jgi:two-component system cell cycle response regulator